MFTPIPDKDEARRVAEQFAPVVVQGVKNLWKDAITPIYVGDFLMEMTAKPTAYYSVRQNEDGLRAVSFNFFHRYDWSGTGCGIRDLLDSHEFDFEGVCFVDDGHYWWTILQAHNSLSFHYRKGQPEDEIYIEPKGHAIRPMLRYRGNLLRYENYALEPLEEYADPFRAQFRRAGVDWPDQVGHRRLERKEGRERVRGLIYRDPLELVRLAQKHQMI